jgi:hypothetical protein
VGRRRSSPPRQGKDSKRHRSSAPGPSSVAPPPETPSIPPSAPIQVMSEIDEIDAGWE